jgi:hypothetical protein
MENKNNNYIQEIIKDLTSKMDLITEQIKLLFDFMDRFKHKRHLIIYSYLLGYYNSKKVINFTQEILFKALDIFNRSLTRKTDLSNLIINISLSLNYQNKNENKKEEEIENININDNQKPKQNETILEVTKNPYILYNDLFGETVQEKPLTNSIALKNKINTFNKNNVTFEKKQKDIIIENKNKNNISFENSSNYKLNDIEKNIIGEDYIVSFGKNKNTIIIKENEEQKNNIKNNYNTVNNNIVNNNIISNIPINNEVINDNIIKDNKINYKSKNQNTKFIKKYSNDNIKKVNPIIKINDNDNYNNLLYKTVTYNVKKINEKDIGTGIKNQQKIVKCFLCSENFNELDKRSYKLNCNCIIHYKCFNIYIINSIEKYKIPIICPKCGKEINANHIYDSLNAIGDQNLIKKYETKCFDLYIKNENFNDNKNEYYYCPTPDCNYYFLNKNNDTKFSCPQCHKDYCLKCFRSWHNNKKCEDFLFETSVKEAQNQTNEIFKYEKDDNYRECPKCHVFIQRLKGSKKIKCICGITFCFKCGDIIKGKHKCQ